VSAAPRELSSMSCPDGRQNDEVARESAVAGRYGATAAQNGARENDPAIIRRLCDNHDKAASV